MVIITVLLPRLKEGEEIKEEDWPDVEVRQEEEEGHTISSLTIRSLVRERFGTYSCKAEGLESKNVTVHVIDGGYSDY